MKTRLSIALGAIALAAVAFVAMRPSEAYANLEQVRQALKKVKDMHAVSTLRKGSKTVTQEAWVKGADVRVEITGKPAKILKGEKTFVLTKDDKGEGIWVVGEPLFEGEVTLDFVHGTEGEWKVRPKPGGKPVKDVVFELVAVEVDDTAFHIVGTEEVDGQQTQKAILHKAGDPYRTVMWLDPTTKLPIAAERQKQNGEIWDVVSRVKYDFTKPIPPSMFEPKQVQGKPL